MKRLREIAGDDPKCPRCGGELHTWTDVHDMYICYACQLGGDAVAYVMDRDGLSFREAVELTGWEKP